MTLVIAAQSTDFIVLGADSRGTILDAGGTRVELNTMTKLIPISKHVAILLYGATNEATYLIESFKLKLNKTTDGVNLIAEKFAALYRKEAKKTWGSKPPYFGYVIAGLHKYDNRFVTPRCYSLSSDSYWIGSYQNYAIEGKPMIATYLFTKNYHQDMEIGQLRRLVAIVLAETINIDGDVGGRIRMATIDSEGYSEIPDTDIRQYIRDWEQTVMLSSET